MRAFANDAHLTETAQYMQGVLLLRLHQPSGLDVPIAGL